LTHTPYRDQNLKGVGCIHTFAYNQTSHLWHDACYGCMRTADVDSSTLWIWTKCKHLQLTLPEIIFAPEEFGEPCQTMGKPFWVKEFVLRYSDQSVLIQHHDQAVKIDPSVAMTRSVVRIWCPQNAPEPQLTDIQNIKPSAGMEGAEQERRA